jgi:hypothetical protein
LHLLTWEKKKWRTPCFLLLSEYSVASILLHDRYRLEEEINNFLMIFSSFNLTLRLKRRTTTLHFQLLLFFPVFSKINQVQEYVIDIPQ